MSIDPQQVGAGVLAAVPFARTLGVSFVDVAADGASATASLPDDPALHNHVAGPHAGAMFSLGETASGAVVLAAFGAQLDRTVPLAVRAEIRYKALAMGPLTATARLAGPVEAVVAELDAGRRPEFPVHVEIRTAEGTVCAELTVTWTLRRRQAG